MTRVLSAAILLPLLIRTGAYLPPIATLGLALLAAALSFVEYARLAEALGLRVPRALAGAAVLAACVAVAAGSNATELVLLTALITVGALAVASARPGPGVLADAAASLFPMLYIGLPLGALAALRVAGR